MTLPRSAGELTLIETLGLVPLALGVGSAEAVTAELALVILLVLVIFVTLVSLAELEVPTNPKNVLKLTINTRSNTRTVPSISTNKITFKYL